MRRWGIVITVFYLCVLVAVLVLSSVYLYGGGASEVLLGLFDPETFIGGAWIAWLVIAIFVGAQALLLFLSVDTSHKRLKSRQHVLLSVATIAFAVGLLTTALTWSVVAAIMADDFPDEFWQLVVSPLVFWAIWGVTFYLYREGVSMRLDRTVSWLLNGSVLQLLIAVPCHIIVRQRGDCSAPLLTGYGIATGVAIMLMAFGPSVLFLYQKRLGEYEREPTAEPFIHRHPVSKVFGTLMLGGAALFLFLPLDQDRVFIFEIPTERSAAARAAVTDFSESLGMSTRRQDDSTFALLCDNRSVARFQTGTADEYGVESWRLSVTPDQDELAAALRSILESYGSIEFLPDDGPDLSVWRAKIVARVLFLDDCAPP